MGLSVCLAWMLLCCLQMPPLIPQVETPGDRPAPSPLVRDADSEQQDPPQSTYTIKSRTAMVIVNAVVRTEKGIFAGDLLASDFAVYDNDAAETISLFSREQLPLAMALVVDRSQSVQPYRVQLRNIAEISLKRLKPEDRVALFAFDMNVTQLTTLIGDHQTVAKKVAGITVGDSTNIYDALVSAADYLRMNAPDRRRAIVLISDNCQTFGSVFSDRGALQKLLEAGIALYSIRTKGDNPIDAVLAWISTDNRSPKN